MSVLLFREAGHLHGSEIKDLFNWNPNLVAYQYTDKQNMKTSQEELNVIGKNRNPI